MSQNGRAEALSFLRAKIARIETGDTGAQPERAAPRHHAFYEIAPAEAGDMGAAAGFALMLAGAHMRARRRPLLWIVGDFALREQGLPYAPGLAAYGLHIHDFVLMRMSTRLDLWRAMEEAVKSGVFAAIICEPTALAGEDLPALVRRITLAARAHDARAILLRPPSRAPFLSPSPMRFEIAARSAPADYGLARPLPGPPSWLLRHRGAPGSLPGIRPDAGYQTGLKSFTQEAFTSAALPFDLFAAA